MPSRGRPAGGKNKKRATLFPSGRFSKMLRKGNFAKRVSKNAGTYVAATVGYLVHELLELSSKGHKSSKGRRLTPRDLNIAIRSDEEFGELLKDVSLSAGGVVAGVNPALIGAAKKVKKVKKAKKVAKKEAKKEAKKATKKAAPAKKKGAAKKGAAPAKSSGNTINGVTIGGPTLTRTQSGKVEELARQGSTTHKWQYQSDGGRYQDYDADGSAAVEIAYASWVLDPHIDVRSVASGDWEYMVDFNLMQQQNVKHSAHKMRSIRRVSV